MKKVIYTKIVGVTFDNEDGINRQEIIKTLTPKQELNVIAEPLNPFDSNCQRVETKDGKQVGNIKRELAIDMTKGRKNGWGYKAVITDLTGGDDKNLGVNIELIAYRE